MAGTWTSGWPSVSLFLLLDIIDLMHAVGSCAIVFWGLLASAFGQVGASTTQADQDNESRGAERGSLKRG
jgi:hypothetical protein